MADLHSDLAAWIGRRSERQDAISERLIAEFKATLAPNLASTTAVPPGIFWCLAPDIVPMAELGRDGHPGLGQFLPDPQLPRRMWAGGELLFHGDFARGDRVTKVSTIDDIAFKTGRSGRLCFVTARNRYEVGERLILEERQDIVYRELSSVASPPAGGASAAVLPTDAWTVSPNPTLLFRYSAMTFNGHRIHYDFPYATGSEGYQGLVVHGPLQATFMLNLAVLRLQRLPKRFAYRGLAPLICDRPFSVSAAVRADGGFDLRVAAASGEATMSGTAD